MPLVAPEWRDIARQLLFLDRLISRTRKSVHHIYSRTATISHTNWRAEHGAYAATHGVHVENRVGFSNATAEPGARVSYFFCRGFW